MLCTWRRTVDTTQPFQSFRYAINLTTFHSLPLIRKQPLSQKRVAQQKAQKLTIMEDESSVESKAQALLSTICNEDDPAEVFYKLFPTPEEIHDVTNADVHEDMNQRFATVLDAVLLFTTKHDQGSDDPDFAYIFISIAEAALQEPASYMKRLRNAMAYVALRHSRDGEVSSQGTEKERILAYFLWRLHGSKDEASPLPVTVSAPARDTGDSHVASHDFLPSSRTTRGPCSNCGMTQATNWCSGCSIIKSGKVVFATFYCDRSCMKAHWKTHKPACKELRALRRAAAITTELLLQELQARNRGVIVSVSEEDGLIEMKIAPADPRANLDGAPFRALPRHLVASEEQALACVSAGACGDIVEGGRVLLEVFMRRRQPHF